jgi:rRNA biogenesis protein RRP5
MYQRIKNNDKPLTVGQVLTFSVLSMESNKKTVQLTVDAMKVSKALVGVCFTLLASL